MISYEMPWWSFKDVNYISHEYPMLSDYIGTQIHFHFKNHVSLKGETRYKFKYSPNRGVCLCREQGKKGTREKQKIEFFKLLKEYGIK